MAQSHADPVERTGQARLSWIAPRSGAQLGQRFHGAPELLQQGTGVEMGQRCPVIERQRGFHETQGPLTVVSGERQCGTIMQRRGACPMGIRTAAKDHGSSG